MNFGSYETGNNTSCAGRSSGPCDRLQLRSVLTLEPLFLPVAHVDGLRSALGTNTGAHALVLFSSFPGR